MSLNAVRRCVLLLIGLVVACSEQQGIGVQQDTSPPTVVVLKTAGDSMTVADGIQFSVAALDNLGLKSLSIALSAGYTGQIDTTFTTAVTDITLPVSIQLPQNSTSGGVVVISATALDGANNSSVATDSIFLVNQSALSVRVLQPTNGSITAPGLQLPIDIEAAQETGIRWVGYSTTGVVTAGDSSSFSLPDTVQYQATLDVPAGTADGDFTIVGFAEDSSGRRATSSPVTITVQQVVNDQDPPRVTFTVEKRVEVDDTISVSATDPGGVATIGWIARDMSGTIVASDTTQSSGTLTNVNDKYSLNLTYTTFPQLIEIEAFGIDASGNRGEARKGPLPTDPIRRDTLTVVNGITKALPSGGLVADAIYNRNRNEFYLTNILLNQLEVFQVVDTSYGAAIDVGSQPWGIAFWPRDNQGNNADSVIVANSGGTNFSIVDVSAAGRRERRRHRLPSFLIQAVGTEIDPANNTIKIKIEEFDFSDRPQYVGAVCRPPVGNSCATGGVYAIYSTTPTPGQTGDFADKGTVRWEELNSATPHSHFFWEHAAVAPSPDADSLQILADRGPGNPVDTVLSVAKGIMVDLDNLAFYDSTYVRNSGDFTHALIGEGGVAELARAVSYKTSGALVSTRDTTIIVGAQISGPTEMDLGIAPSLRVRDFVANTATSVRAIAINYNGLTNMVRADSVYLLDQNLFLAGIIPVGGANAGLDLNFQHNFDPFVGGTPGTSGGAGNPNYRMVFLARSDANIDVYDTYFFEKVATIPIRDPIIGPLRVALQPNGDQIMIGATARGIVTVRFPQIPNTFPNIR
jgi:hypothetical protein